MSAGAIETAQSQPPAQRVAMEHVRGPFAGLLTAQVFFIVIASFVDETAAGRALLYTGVLGIMAAGAYLSSSSRHLLVTSLIVLVLLIGAWLGPDLLPGHADELLRLGVAGFGYALTAWIVIIVVARQQRVTTDTILGSVNAYLLLALSFMMLHAAVIVVEPEAYTIGGEPLHSQLHEATSAQRFSTLLYLSFTALTTVGFGDIVPARPVSRLLISAEAVIGQLYVAILIARLVSLEANQRAVFAHPPKEDP